MYVYSLGKTSIENESYKQHHVNDHFCNKQSQKRLKNCNNFSYNYMFTKAARVTGAQKTEEFA